MADAWREELGPGATIPVEAPSRRIDYIFHSPHFSVDTAYVVASDASDHLPVVAVLRMR